MKTNARFIKSIVTTASKSDADLPWRRGARRAAYVAKRAMAAEPERKSA